MSSSLNSSLPDDLVMEVLSLLSIKNSMKSRCVSKSWNTLIESDYFQSLHQNRLKKSSTNLSSLLLPRPNSGRSVLKIRLGENMRTGTSLEELHPRGGLRVVGSCKGVICTLHDNNPLKLVLSNPLFKNCTINIPRPTEINSPRLSDCSFGFGYDNVTEDYKVVWLVVRDVIKRGAVFSLKTMAWENICQLPSRQCNIKCSYHGCSGLFINNNLHWMVNHDYVAAFNLTSCRFEEVPLPPTRDGHFGVNIGILDECFCFTTRFATKPYYKRDYDIWMMKAYGVKDSWTKITLQTCELYCVLMPIMNQYYVDERRRLRQNIIMWGGLKGLLCFEYDVKTKSFPYQTMSRAEEWTVGCEVFQYVETEELVSFVAKQKDC